MFQATVEVTVTSLLPCTPYNITIEPTAKGETASLYFDNFNGKVKVYMAVEQSVYFCQETLFREPTVLQPLSFTKQTLAINRVFTKPGLS